RDDHRRADRDRPGREPAQHRSTPQRLRALTGMARRHQHEEHTNHEAWAIPYGDLMTLLLAFFVVMYAISSINEGKYRAVSDALSSAFGGTPRSITPIQLGQTQLRGSAFDRPSLMTPGAKAGPTSTSLVAKVHVQQR